MVNFKTHAKKRISQRTSASKEVIQKILENKEYIRLGFDIKKDNVCYYLFYFGSDDEYYILSIDERTQDVITILYALNFKPFHLDFKVFKEAKAIYLKSKIENGYNILNNDFDVINFCINSIPYEKSNKFKKEFENIEKNLSNFNYDFKFCFDKNTEKLYNFIEKNVEVFNALYLYSINLKNILTTNKYLNYILNLETHIKLLKKQSKDEKKYEFFLLSSLCKILKNNIDIENFNNLNEFTILDDIKKTGKKTFCRLEENCLNLVK